MADQPPAAGAEVKLEKKAEQISLRVVGQARARCWAASALPWCGESADDAMR